MFSRSLRALAFGAALAVPCGAAMADTGSLSPVFGGAHATALSQTQAKNVKGKGAYSVYYGLYANYYASYALYLGNVSVVNDYAGYSSSYTYYYSAYQYASAASSYYYNAYYYKVNGNQ